MICVIDPALENHTGALSPNLGDVVIFRAIARCLEAFFPGEEVCRISSHEPFKRRHYELLRDARLTFLGGSNLLSSDLLTYNQWNFANSLADYARSEIENSILFGIGWWQYQESPNAFTTRFYRRVLSRRQTHSARDRYTAAKLRDAGIVNVISTGCPSIWDLHGARNDRPRSADCLVMLTDYYPNYYDDDAFLRAVRDHFSGSIVFFPQGRGDIAYLRTLPVYGSISHRLEILDHSLEKLEAMLRARPLTYVGTRLHGGILAMTYGLPSVILAVDNRATEKGHDFHLPVIPRPDAAALARWLRGEAPFPEIAVPHALIERWCEQFGPQAYQRFLSTSPLSAPPAALPI